MWIHPDLVDEVTPWTTVSRKKSRSKTKQANVIIASSIEPDSDVNSLTDSEEEEEVLAASVAGPLAAATRSGRPYLRNYAMLRFNNSSRLKNRSRNLPSSLRPCQKNRRRSGIIDPFIKEKRSRYPNPSASTLSTSWPTFRPGSLSTSSSNYPSQPGRLLEKRWLTPKSSSLSSPMVLLLMSRTA